MKEIKKRYLKKKGPNTLLRTLLHKSEFAYLQIRLFLPICILGIILVIVLFLFKNRPKENAAFNTQQNIQTKPEVYSKNINTSDIDVSFPESASPFLSNENIKSNTIIKEDTDLKLIKWSWIDENDKKEVTWTADEAFQDATNYVHGAKPKQLEALKMYQRVLDAKPLRQMELHIRLTMGSRMMILYDPSLGEHEMYSDAFKWYEQLVHDFNDMGNHTDIMTAKIHLGDLYCWRPSHGIAEAQKASALCWEVINIPENDIIFDSQLEQGLSLEKIKNAHAPGSRAGPQATQKWRQHLLEQRQEVVNRYRLTAIRSLITKQNISGFPREVYLERLISLKKERLDDQLYQQMLDNKIQEVSKTLVSSHSEFEEVQKEGLKSLNNP
jgi:hypothetical protein